jgi:hypothetical protein
MEGIFMNNKETKQCPFCNKLIPASAIKCKYCESDIIKQEVQDNETYGNLMIVIPLAFVFLVLMFENDFKLSQNYLSKLKVIHCLALATTSILATIEASKLGMGDNSDLNKKGKKRIGPITWFLFIFFIWIVAYPMYLYHRSKYGLKNRLWAGILTVIIFHINFIYAYFNFQLK